MTNRHAPGSGFKKRRLGIAVPAVLLAVSVLSACSPGSGSDVSTRQAPDAYWKKGAGADEVSVAMKVEIPPGATELKGAVRINPQEDQYLLSFVTGSEQAEMTAETLKAEDPLSRTRKGTASGKLFGHLGLTPPESLGTVRWTGVCPPCVGDSSRSALQWIEIYIEPLPKDEARVYLQAF